MAGGLTYAEMGSMFPRSGGLYVFLSEAYGPVWGFLFGWACLLVILTGSVATVAVGFAEYFSYFVPALGTDRRLLTLAMPWGAWSISAGQLVAAGSIAVITAINYVGVRSGNLANTVLTAAKVGALVAVLLLAVVYLRVEPAWHAGRARRRAAAAGLVRHHHDCRDVDLRGLVLRGVRRGRDPGRARAMCRGR